MRGQRHKISQGGELPEEHVLQVTTSHNTQLAAMKQSTNTSKFLDPVCSGILPSLQRVLGTSLPHPATAAAIWAFPTKTGEGCRFCLAKLSQSTENKVTAALLQAGYGADAKNNL